MRPCRATLRIFAVPFGMGVVTGIVMAFRFSNNWRVLAEKTGSICSAASPTACNPPRRNRQGECHEHPDPSNLQRLTSQTHNRAQTRHG
jgi:hypothetical protein